MNENVTEQSTTRFSKELRRGIRNLRRRLRNKTLLSTKDALTGLYNRSGFDDGMVRCAAEAKRRNVPIAVMMSDVNGLKTVNDRDGHQAGDLLLKNFASFLKKRSRGEDVVARYGADEFSVIMVGLNKKDSEIVLKNYKESLPNGISAAFGLACFPGDVTSLEELMGEADRRMYEDKRRSKANAT